MKTDSQESPRRERRSFTASQKVTVVKRHLLERVAVSDLCDEAAITPTQFYQWQKQLFGVRSVNHSLPQGLREGC